MSRCTDELGQVQPTAAEFARYFNWTTDYLFSHPGVLTGHNNYILPWKVDRDGKVQNALA
jgi:hypothetical protein